MCPVESKLWDPPKTQLNAGGTINPPAIQNPQTAQALLAISWTAAPLIQGKKSQHWISHSLTTMTQHRKIYKKPNTCQVLIANAENVLI